MGRAALAMDVILVLEMPLATKRLTPTGGVRKPMARLTTMMTPKCRGETPTPVTMGNKMGVRMTMAASASMKTPTISSRMLMIRRIKILLLVKLRMARAMVPGTSSMVMMLPKMVAMAIRTIMVAEVSADSTQHSHSLRKLISL